jgi:uroporphyrinogen III methyltransferase/synthase
VSSAARPDDRTVTDHLVFLDRGRVEHMSTSPTTPGTVYLVGAGPGDPGLITLRGVECLARADVVLYDYLANPAVVEHAPGSAELVALGHPDAGRALTPDEIAALMVRHARGGRTVVRLKGGDPSVFGRGADETTALREAGVPFEIVPGITAGLAVAAYCEIPITQQDDASAVALVAGRERRDKVVSHLDYAALARFPGTLVFYMGVGRVAEWRDALVEHGKPPETPVAIVRWCTRPQQRTLRCSLGTVVDVVEREGLRPPAVFVVGAVVDRAPERSWFTARPLFGTRVLVAGSPATSELLRRRLGGLGADVLAQPAIRITDPPDWGPVDAALERLDQYDWLVFSSANGVDYLFRRLLARGGDLRRLARVKLAAIGSGTAERLARWHLRADVVPEEFVAESLAEALIGDARGRRFLVARASRGRLVLGAALERAGAHVDQVVVYGSVDVEQPDAAVARALAAGDIDWVTVTSSATARSLARLYGAALGTARFASIGPLTSAALRELGYEPAVEASPHTTGALADAILASR